MKRRFWTKFLGLALTAAFALTALTACNPNNLPPEVRRAMQTGDYSSLESYRGGQYDDDWDDRYDDWDDRYDDDWDDRYDDWDDRYDDWDDRYDDDWDDRYDDDWDDLYDEWD